VQDLSWQDKGLKGADEGSLTVSGEDREQDWQRPKQGGLDLRSLLLWHWLNRIVSPQGEAAARHRYLCP